MKSFARFTAVAFIILGIALLVGAWIFLAANSGPGVRVAESDGTPIQALPLSPTTSRLIATALGLQGLFLCAIGEVLWLFADVADDTNELRKSMVSLREDSSANRDFLAAIVHRINPPKK